MVTERFNPIKKAASIAAFLIISLFSGEMAQAITHMEVESRKAKVRSEVKRDNRHVKERSTFETPDFAFPATVEQDALPVYKKAMAEGNGLEALRAAIQIIVARSMVSKTSFIENAHMLDSMSRELPQPYAGLSSLLAANLYGALYDSQSWVFNQRTLPLDSYPEDPFSWSRDHFAKKVMELVSQANKGRDVAKESPIPTLAPLLDNTEMAEREGLTVWDFMVYNEAAQLSRFCVDGNGGVIPFYKESVSMSSSTETGKCFEERDRLITGLYEYRVKAGTKSPLAVAICEKSEIMPEDERAGFLKGWYYKLKEDVWGGVILDRWYRASEGFDRQSDDIREIYDCMKEWISRYPRETWSEIVRYDISAISKKNATLSLPTSVLPEVPLKGSLKLGNMTEAYVLLYKIPEESVAVNSLVRKDFPGKCRLVKSIKVEKRGEMPFSEEAEIELPPLSPGYYVALPSATPRLSSTWKRDVGEWQLNIISVSDIAIISSGNREEKGSSRVYVVDARTQRPLSGAEVCIYEDRNSGKRLVSRGYTDEKGSYPTPSGNHRVRASYRGNVAWRWDDSHLYKREDKVEEIVKLLTDLSIYKPGERVRFALVGWERKSHQNSLLKHRDVRVVMRDANYNPIDTLKLTTDTNGRSEGMFRIPESGLLGSYSLVASFEGESESISGRCMFQVAEYKSPGFFVELESEAGTAFNCGEVARFKGIVKTYSGMPLGDSEISYNVKWEPWWLWWRRGYESASYGGTLRSGSDGKFEIELPTANLKGTRFEHGIFTLSVSAVSPSGESQNAPDIRFALGDGTTIRPSIPEREMVSGDSIRFRVPVYDMLDHPVVRDVDYSVVNIDSEKEVISGTFRSPELVIAGALMPSSRYRLTFNLPGDTVKTTSEVAVYRAGDERPPYETELWVPERRVVCGTDADSVRIDAGSGYPGSWILCEVSDENGILRREWREADGRNISLDVKTPAKNSRVWITLSGMHNLSQKVATVEIIPEEQTRKLEVKASTFRDKITAGGKEVWKFEFSVDGKSLGGVPAMAVMSNKALNALAPFRWDFTAGQGYWTNSSYLSYENPGIRNVTASFGVMPRYRSIPSPVPTWNTYSCSLVDGGYNGVRIRGLKAAKTRGGADGVEEVLNTVYLTSAPMMDKMMKAEETSQAEASADMEEPIMSAGSGDTGESGIEKPRPRPVEMPLAFFMPTLVGDADGIVKVSFETPDFNTTWQFQIVGYTEDLLTAGLVMDAVASKPVMVQSNVPRYLRSGDKASVSALLFNNSSLPLPIHGEIRIFNPSTGETITSLHKGAETVAPSENRQIATEFTVPTDVTAIGFESYALSDDFSDGESVLIPVLPSSTPVVESTGFYIGRGMPEFSMKLPKLRKDANVTFKYCDNPLWECVLAMPSISKPESKNILSLIKGLYANSVSLGIVGKYHQVKSGLEKALADKDVKSNLEKDSSLKTVGLENTPWVNNAASETARMRSLSTLFDSEKGKEAVESILREVKSLQNSDGGWSWCPEMKSSLYMTERTLLHFGMMRQMGFLPAGTAGMIENALRYCDSQIYKEYVESQKTFSVSSMLDYLYVRSFFDAGNGPSGFKDLKSEALRRISEEWLSMPIYGKATAAILLSRSKGYESESKRILESLRQLASKSESKGWWYDNIPSGPDGMSSLMTVAQVLEAFTEASPDSPAVDGLRQWLVLQKETEDWGSNPYTVEVVQSILSSGSDWTVSAGYPEVTVGGKRLSLPEGESPIGVSTVTLDASEVSGKKLTVSRKTEGPAWGGVISQYVAPMKEVGPASSANLKVEKRLMVVTDTPSGETVREESTFKVGDKVRVTLTVTCGKDMNYVALTDERSACLEPDVQISGYEVKEGLWMYREIRDDKTSFFIGFLPKGVNVITYDCHVGRVGEYAIGIATVQSQYSPLQTAHSSGRVLTVE